MTHVPTRPSTRPRTRGAGVLVRILDVPDETDEEKALLRHRQQMLGCEPYDGGMGAGRLALAMSACDEDQ